jgi:Leucine-rich repeat (LRR) protein
LSFFPNHSGSDVNLQSPNPLGYIPTGLGHCINLKVLGLGDCKLTSLPEWFGKKLKNLQVLLLFGNPDLVELPNSIRFVKQAIFRANKQLGENSSYDCDRVEAMVQAASDRVWKSQRILLTARPPPQSEDDDEKEKGNLLSEFQHCHEVLFGGDETRRNYLTKMIKHNLI